MAKDRSKHRYGNGYRRRDLRHWLLLQHRDCWICREFGRPARIDYDAGPYDPRAFQVDELNPVSKGGSPYDRGNVDAAHRACNIWRGNRSVEEVKRIAAAVRAGATLGDAERGAALLAAAPEIPKQRVTSCSY